MRKIVFLIMFINILAAVAWIGNIYKFTQCDFKEDYKCEIVHGVGLIPYASIVTIWFETD